MTLAPARSLARSLARSQCVVFDIKSHGGATHHHRLLSEAGALRVWGPEDLAAEHPALAAAGMSRLVHLRTYSVGEAELAAVSLPPERMSLPCGVDDLCCGGLAP